MKKENEVCTKAHIYKKIFRLVGVILIIFILGLIDWWTGYEFDFFLFYFIPVSIAAWFFGFELAIAISILCASVWFFSDKLSGHYYSSQSAAVWNTVIRLVSFISIGWSVHKIFILLHLEKAKSKDLEKALLDIKVLESFLAICCVCKKIHNEEGKWQQIESYISNHSVTTFSHGYCPECLKKAMEEADMIIKKPEC